MIELFNQAFSPANLPITVLLITVLVYWLFVMLGTLDLEFFDIDFDLDADVDADMDLDLNPDVGVGDVGWWISLLQFFNVGKLPFMIFFSFLILIMWTLCMLTNDFMGNTALGYGLFLMLPIFVVSLFLNKIVTLPFVALFEKMDADSPKIDLIGQICTVISPVVTAAKMGQAEITLGEHHLTINVKAIEGQRFSKNDKVMIAKQNKDEQYYWIEKNEWTEPENLSISD